MQEFFQIYGAVVTTIVLILLPLARAGIKFTSDIKQEVQRISQFFDEESDVSKAMGGSLPTIFKTVQTTLNDVVKPEEMIRRVAQLESQDEFLRQEIKYLREKVDQMLGTPSDG